MTGWRGVKGVWPAPAMSTLVSHLLWGLANAFQAVFLVLWTALWGGVSIAASLFGQQRLALRSRTGQLNRASG